MMGPEETAFQERLRFLEREDKSIRKPTTGVFIVYQGDEEVKVWDSKSNIINLAVERYKRKGV